MTRTSTLPRNVISNIVKGNSGNISLLKPSVFKLHMNQPFQFHGSYDIDFKDHNDFIKKMYSRPPIHTIEESLPNTATDIKGVDSAVYGHMQKKQILKKLPPLVNNKYFLLKFLPHQHYLALARKSNIAYTFTNRGGYKLNNLLLDKALANYNGKYKTLSFFQENLFPLNTAVNRAKYRKFVKRLLFEAVIDNADIKTVSLVSGIFSFRFMTVPISEEDRHSVKNALDGAVKTVLHNKKFRDKLFQVVNLQNSNTKNIDQLLAEVSKYNTIGAKNVPGYYPKLPFLRE